MISWGISPADLPPDRPQGLGPWLQPQVSVLEFQGSPDWTHSGGWVRVVLRLGGARILRGPLLGLFR